MESKKESITLEDRESKEVSLTKIHVENYYDRNEHDALMSQFDDDPFLEKPRDPPKLILEPFPNELKYAFLGENSTWPIVIPSSIFEQVEEMVLNALRKYKEAMGWTIFYLERINPMAYTNYNNPGDTFAMSLWRTI